MPVRRCSIGSVLGFGEGVSGVGQHVGEPVRDQTSTRRRDGDAGRVARVLGGEAAALGDGGDVGPVDGEDGVEHVACFGDVT